MFERIKIISLRIDHVSFKEALLNVINWATEKRSSYVCFATVHSIIEAYTNIDFKNYLANSDIVIADGKPVAIACKLLHDKKQEKISGPDFVPAILEQANERKLSVFFYGSTVNVLKAIETNINSYYPGIHFAGSISPPFRPLTDDEMEADINIINKSKAHLIFVSLGCPKQEKWMATCSQKINGVLLGVGAAVPILAGSKKRAPEWMQKIALEWLYRFRQEPRRLFKRYVFANLYFLFLMSKELSKNFLKQP